MRLNTADMIKQKLLDVQENVRDFQSYADKVEDERVKEYFKDFAKDSAYQAQKLQQLLSEYETI